MFLPVDPGSGPEGVSYNQWSFTQTGAVGAEEVAHGFRAQAQCSHGSSAATPGPQDPPEASPGFADKHINILLNVIVDLRVLLINCCFS